MKTSVLLGSLLGATAISAHPHPRSHSSGVMRRRVEGLSEFKDTTVAKYSSARVTKSDSNLAIHKRGDYVTTATEFVKSYVPNADFRVVKDHYVGKNGIAHVHFKQQVHGIDIDNANFNVNIARDGTVFSFGNTFVETSAVEENPLTKRAFSSPEDALKAVISKLGLNIFGNSAAYAIDDEDIESYTLSGTGGAESDPETRLKYWAKGDNDLTLTWRVETDVRDDWLLTYVDAKDNKKFHSVINYVSDATYEVYPWGVNDPTEGDRVVVTDPWDSDNSAYTWIGDGAEEYTTTEGNNAIAQINHDGDYGYKNEYRPDSASLKFEYPYSPDQTNPNSYVDASITQLFYTGNMYHDVLYELGFNEEAGNFQTNDGENGGKGNDNVILNAQDGSGMNNANFATPPDGQHGRMRMYLWNTTMPIRDCAFEAGVVIHEHSHGLSTRLTGGPANSGCLPDGESGGMGEGWGDWIATAIRLKEDDTRDVDYGMGDWVAGENIRSYPYSTNMDTNPYTYGSTNQFSEVHDLGEIWAEILYEVLWNLIDKHGLSVEIMPTFDEEGVPTDGKFLALKLIVDAMALQPCHPTFVQARDAIIDADENLTGGANSCELWTAFAKRGLGENAEYGQLTDNVEDFTIPADAGC